MIFSFSLFRETNSCCRTLYNVSSKFNPAKETLRSWLDKPHFQINIRGLELSSQHQYCSQKSSFEKYSYHSRRMCETWILRDVFYNQIWNSGFLSYWVCSSPPFFFSCVLILSVADIQNIWLLRCFYWAATWLNEWTHQSSLMRN